MTDDEHPSCWRRIRAELRRAVPESTWHQWLEPLTGHQREDGTLVVVAPEHIRPWVEQRFGDLLERCAGAVLGAGTVVAIEGADAEAGGRRSGVRGGERADAGARTGASPGPATRTRASRQTRAGTEPVASASGDGPQPCNPRHTFEQFVIGDSNRLAHAAALAVAELPGLAYNPLFICGPPGVGKTHLLHSIGNYVTAYGGGATVRYTTAEAFTNHFLGALHGKDTDRFKAAYRGVDVLLLDDVQFLQAKARTEEEFFHTFNALHEGGAQIVLTSDRLPRDLGELEERLRERFEAGLVTDVRAPDLATRETILRKRVQQDRIPDIDPAALQLLAERVTDNVRALEGALVRVVAFGSLTGRPVTPELADEVIAGLYPELRRARRPTSVREIQERTAEAFGVSVDQLVSASRAGGVAWPRQVAMYLARELTDQTLPAIGKAFGGRNHTTVLHAYKRTAERIAGDPAAFEIVRRLTELLGAGDDRP